MRIRMVAITIILIALLLLCPTQKATVTTTVQVQAFQTTTVFPTITSTTNVGVWQSPPPPIIMMIGRRKLSPCIPTVALEIIRVSSRHRNCHRLVQQQRSLSLLSHHDDDDDDDRTTATSAAAASFTAGGVQRFASPPAPPYHNHNNHNELELELERLDLRLKRVGDDSAYFDWQEQSLREWILFTVATSAVLTLLAWVWILPSGPQGGNLFLDWIQTTLLGGSTDPAATVATMLIIFAIAHSGLAGVRPYAESVVGPRAWRVLFAVVSLPLALSSVSYFINHAHEGTQLWQCPSDNPLVHAILFTMNFVSFLFLYPSTFNLLEIAAVQKPQLHLYETGVIRITRHPQAFGQLLWCIAHTAHLGTLTAVSASTILLLHHALACYHGDVRLAQRHGEAFSYIQNRTSIVPFQAIIEGRQVLPHDYYKEYLRGPYALIVMGTLAAYVGHPYLQAGAALLNW